MTIFLSCMWNTKKAALRSCPFCIVYQKKVRRYLLPVFIITQGMGIKCHILLIQVLSSLFWILYYIGCCVF